MCHLLNYLTHYLLVSFVVVYRRIQNTLSRTRLLNPPTLRHLHKFLVHHYQLRIWMAEIAVNIYITAWASQPRLNKCMTPTKGVKSYLEQLETWWERRDKIGCTNSKKTCSQKTNHSVYNEAEIQLWLVPVVQKLDSTIHRINHYPVDKY